MGITLVDLDRLVAGQYLGRIHFVRTSVTMVLQELISFSHVPRPSGLKNITYIKQFCGKLMFDSSHNFHVVQCTSRNYTWKAGILCVIDGVDYYMENIWGE